MSPGKRDPDSEAAQAVVYQIRIKGQLGSQWADWFEGMALTLEDNGATRMTGAVIDQAALFGLLRKVRDLGLPLLSVIRVEASKEEVAAELTPDNSFGAN